MKPREQLEVEVGDSHSGLVGVEWVLDGDVSEVS
jgi:hypothetical protein